MVSVSIQADSLVSFYRQIVAAQEAAHGKGYCSHHRVIASKAGECATYCELGVNQGATLACAILAGFVHCWGVDISAAPFRVYEPLFRPHGAFRGVVEQDSRVPLPACDFLLIDSLHTPRHLREELAVHGPHVRRYILVHDTATFPALAAVLDQWARANDWTVQQAQARNAGWTLLAKRV